MNPHRNGEAQPGLFDPKPASPPAWTPPPDAPATSKFTEEQQHELSSHACAMLMTGDGEYLMLLSPEGQARGLEIMDTAARAADFMADFAEAKEHGFGESIRPSIARFAHLIDVFGLDMRKPEDRHDFLFHVRECLKEGGGQPLDATVFARDGSGPYPVK